MKAPKLCKTPRGFAFVYLDRKKVYLGRYGTAEAVEKYAAIVAAFERRAIPAKICPCTAPVTLASLAADYLTARANYYVKNGKQTGQLERFKTALSFALNLYAAEAVDNIGPRRLATIRDEMESSGRFGRVYINTLISCLRGVFRWGVENELVKPETLTALKALEPLKRGRSSARERAPVKPVDPEIVKRTIEHLTSVVGDMVRLQALSGLRPGEICQMRAGDLTPGPAGGLIYTLSGDKTDYRRAVGDLRQVPLGPRAAALLAPYLLAREGDPDAYIFQPAEAVAEISAARRRARKTPLTPSQRARKASRIYHAHYTTEGYRRAVIRAAERAGVSKWTPNQLRHLFATQIRAKYGLEAAQILLGHSRADVTQIYAERDFKKAQEVAARVG